jgi:hypothetical protein
MPRPARSPLLVLPLTALALTACAGEPADTSGASAGPSATASAPTSASAPASPGSTATAAPTPSGVALGSGAQSSPPSAPAAQNAFEISFAEDRASGETGRLVVGVGETVSIRVTSLRADEVHLHGYDIATPVRADLPAVIEFTADIPGVFELELEELGAELATLQVQVQ